MVVSVPSVMRWIHMDLQMSPSSHNILYSQTCICVSYYSPFGDALDSAPRESSNAPTNKKTYQMDPANGIEALTEAKLDVAEGSDMLMVKPGLPFLDIIRRLKDETTVPIAAYHVSEEYAMMKAAAQKGWLDERDTVLETLLCFKLAGTDTIRTYYAKQAAQWMQ